MSEEFRGYQYGFSDNSVGSFDEPARKRKARTMRAVLESYLDKPLDTLNLLNVGGSTGILDNYLADYFAKVVGSDIDEPAIIFANNNFKKNNLEFQVADALALPFTDASFDVVVCSHVYEHVPDPLVMMNEIHRVLKSGGVCYFAAGNRLMYNEPHHNLPLLSVLPRPLAHIYIRMAGKADFYYEKHLSYWGLKRLVKQFDQIDYTVTVTTEAEKYFTDYMIRPGSLKARVAGIVLKYFYWMSPGYLWLLQKY